jgi:hypothetical protein
VLKRELRCSRTPFEREVAGALGVVCQGRGSRLALAERRTIGGVRPAMAIVNVNDRSSLERVYPEDAFAHDAAQNERVPNVLLHGVLIGSAPDDSGCFEVDQATRHAGELKTAHFLAPTRRGEELIKEGEHRSPRQVALPQPTTGYRQFLDDIIETARRVGFRADQSPGYGERRLKGFRGG